MPISYRITNIESLRYAISWCSGQWPYVPSTWLLNPPIVSDRSPFTIDEVQTCISETHTLSAALEVSKWQFHANLRTIIASYHPANSRALNTIVRVAKMIPLIVDLPWQLLTFRENSGSFCRSSHRKRCCDIIGFNWSWIRWTYVYDRISERPWDIYADLVNMFDRLMRAPMIFILLYAWIGFLANQLAKWSQRSIGGTRVIPRVLRADGNGVSP